jgi:hypothetical protein
LAIKIRKPPVRKEAGEDLPAARPIRRIVAVVVALEHYRGGDLPEVEFAHADADAFAVVLRSMFADLSADDVQIEVFKDSDASLTGLKSELGYRLGALAEDDLFVFYYAGHGFHGAGGNRLSAYDTSRTNVADTSLNLREILLEPLSQSECRRSLLFIDACAEQFQSVASSRDVISNLDADEVERFLESGWYCGVFLSCSPREKSYPSVALRHGIWTHFLIEALSGRAEEALTDDRWLTDTGLRDYLKQEVRRYITRETTLRGRQTPQAILSASNSFRIRQVPRPPSVPADAALIGIRMRNNSEFLEGVQTGAINWLSGFRKGVHTVPKDISDSAEKWCHKLLADQVADELQDYYERAREALQLRRRDLRKEDDEGGGNLDTPAFRYSIETGQNPDDPSEYIVRRRLELQQGWPAHREAIDEIFEREFQLLVVEFESLDETFDELVDKLEDIEEEQGGSVQDDDRARRVTYSRDGVSFMFDLRRRRLEISFGSSGSLDLVDGAQAFQLGIDRASPMLPAPQTQRPSTAARSGKGKTGS